MFDFLGFLNVEILAYAGVILLMIFFLLIPFYLQYHADTEMFRFVLKERENDIKLLKAKLERMQAELTKERSALASCEGALLGDGEAFFRNSRIEANEENEAGKTDKGDE